MQPVLPWLRANLALVVFFSSLLSGAMGMLVTTGSVVNDLKHVLLERGATLADHTTQLRVLHVDMIDVDRRLNEQRTEAAELRRQRDGEIATLDRRIAVLEAQLRFLADRTPTPQPLSPRR